MEHHNDLAYVGVFLKGGKRMVQDRLLKQHLPLFGKVSSRPLSPTGGYDDGSGGHI